MGTKQGSDRASDRASGRASKKPPAAALKRDPAYRAAVLDVLGVIAYSELSAFARMAADARLAPDLNANVALSRMAVAELEHFGLLEARLAKLGIDPAEAMAPFVEVVDTFHEQTAPSDWLEGLVKVYVGDGIARDFYGEIASFLDASTEGLVREAVTAILAEDYIVGAVRAAIEKDPTVKGRLALWARRLVGEALTQAHGVARDRDQLTNLVAAGDDPDAVAKIFVRITQAHGARVAALGLD